MVESIRDGPRLSSGSGFLLVRRRHSTDFLLNAWGPAVKALKEDGSFPTLDVFPAKAGTQPEIWT
jgi:hypothetical protein